MQLTGRIDDAIELMERTAAEVADDQPDADIGLLLARLGQAYWFAGKTDRALDWTERALEIAEALQLTAFSSAD